jgi:hypothetical protein
MLCPHLASLPAGDKAPKVTSSSLAPLSSPGALASSPWLLPGPVREAAGAGAGVTM